MSPEESALRAAINADPDSDLPRLVFADWLEENGRAEYAEFIRVQIELARTNPEDESHLGLHLRERELLRILTEELEAEKPELPKGMRWEDPIRGFVDRVEFGDRVSAETAEQQLEAIARVVPLRGVLDAFEQSLPEFIRCPAFARIEYLNEHIEDGADAVVHALAESRYANRLRHLDFPFLDITNADLAILAGAKSLGRLTRLELGWRRLTSAARPSLQTATWRKSLRGLRLFGGEKFHLAAKGVTFPELRSLFLFGVELTRPLAAVMNDTACLPRLTDLELFGNYFGGTPSESPKLAPLARSLTRLHLEHIDLGPEGLRRLLDTPTAETLRTFELEVVHAGPTWLTDLAAAKLPRLRSFTLDCDDNEPDPAALLALAGASFWATVEELNITRFKKAVKPTAWAAFFGALNAPRLRRLEVWWSSVGVNGVTAIAANPSLAGLRWLELRNCGLTDPGLRAVLDSPHLQRLVLLEAQVQRGREAFDLLADSAVLPHARRIDISGSRATAEQAKKLRARGAVKIGTK